MISRRYMRWSIPWSGQREWKGGRRRGRGGEESEGEKREGEGRRDFAGRGGAKHVEYALLMQTGRSSSYYITSISSSL